jgi:hypothetical protein
MQAVEFIPRWQFADSFVIQGSALWQYRAYKAKLCMTKKTDAVV